MTITFQGLIINYVTEGGDKKLIENKTLNSQNKK